MANLPSSGPAVSLTQIRSRGRLVLPKICRRTVQWLEGAGAIDVVLELASPGRILVAPEDTRGRELDQQRDLIEREIKDAETRDELLLAMALTYRRASVEPSGRLPLDPESLDHLDIAVSDEAAQVYLVAKPDALEIWSQAYHSDFRKKHLQELLERLPEGMRHDQRLLRLLVG